ncbi:MAG: hypothetical protein NVSMB18_12780 [Acetobacteraceae bacterium]
MAGKIWSAGVSGIWGNGLNWSPSGYAGPADDAIIYGPSPDYQTITGNGTSSTLTIVGNTTLSGLFSTGALYVGTTMYSGALSLTSGGVLASTASILFGPLQVSSSGTKLTVTGTLFFGGARTSGTLTANSLVVSTGAVVQSGNVVMQPTPGGNGIIVQDLSSIVEIGSTDGAARGAITVDVNRTINGLGSLIAPNGIINQGTITAQSGMLAIGGGVTGSGFMQIAANSVLYLMSGVSNQAVIFGGVAAQLEITQNLAGGLTETGVITGFLPGDSILFASGTPLTSVTYRPGSNGVGTLALNNGAILLGTLTLQGNYTGFAFQVTPNASYGALISVVKAGSSGGTATGGSPGTDAFGWIATGGSWNAASNWQDLTALASGVAVPGSANSGTLNGPTGSATQTIVGPGAAASIKVLGNTTLSGSFTAGLLAVGTASTAGGLKLGPDGILAVQAASIPYGSLNLSGVGAQLSVAGGMVLGGARTSTNSSLVANTLTLSTGATVQVGALTLNSGPAGNAITVDGQSSLEIGTIGSALPGFITVDPGRTLIGTGLLVAKGGVVNAGTITAYSGLLQIGSSVSGTGQLEIRADSTLYIYDGTTSQPIAFTQPRGTLEMTLTSAGTLSETGPISGFTLGDTIFYASSMSLTNVSYQAGANGTGTLTLNNGGTVIGTLPLIGDYFGSKFQVQAHGAYGYDITVTPRFTSPDPLFDPIYYLKTYPDVAAGGIDPYSHYMNYGWREGRNPSASFNTLYYLNQNPDIASAGINPLTHFENYGWKEGRDPSVLFSVRGYVAANPDLAGSPVDPLLHYVLYGKLEGRVAPAATPHSVGTVDPGVDYGYYYARHPDVAAAGLDASMQYNMYGYKNGYNPSPYFDTNFYLTQYPDIKNAGIDPLTHYEMHGWIEGRLPSLTFSGNSYLAANPDLKAGNVDPLLHGGRQVRGPHRCAQRRQRDAGRVGRHPVFRQAARRDPHSDGRRRAVGDGLSVRHDRLGARAQSERAVRYQLLPGP